MGLEVGVGGTEEKEKEEEKEKIPLYESMGHRPLLGRCPAPTLNYNDLPKQGTGTADHLLRLSSMPFCITFRLCHPVSKKRHLRLKHNLLLALFSDCNFVEKVCGGNYELSTKKAN